MDIIKYIIIRKEHKMNEFRVPLVPNDIIMLIEKGYTVYVEKSKNRCVSTEEYIAVGCIIIECS